MKILFVCLGNICRSPTAHGVLAKKLADQSIDWVQVESAGTASYHLGSPPDKRTQKAAKAAGYDLSSLRAQQVKKEDFFNFDYIFAMDNSNLANLERIMPEDSTAKLALFLDQTDTGFTEVPDPYYGDDQDFKTVIRLCEKACDGIINNIINAKT